MALNFGRCQFMMLEKKRNISKSIEDKTQSKNIFRIKEKSNTHKTSLHKIVTCIVTNQLIAWKSFSKLTSCVMTQTLPVSVSLNLMDPLEFQKP